MKSSLDERRELVSTLVEGSVVVEEADPREFAVDLAGLFAEERASIERAVVKRQREFIAGRTLARAGMRRLGLQPQAIRVGEDRAPIWPAGLLGSISHTMAWCAAAIAKSEDVCALGIDVEDDSPLATELWPTICTHEELLRLEKMPAARRGLAAKLIFSAKESAYKAQHCLTGQFLDFDAMEVELDHAVGGWRATFRSGHRPSDCPWDVVGGRWIHQSGLIATAVVVAK